MDFQTEKKDLLHTNTGEMQEWEMEVSEQTKIYIYTYECVIGYGGEDKGKAGEGKTAV